MDSSQALGHDNIGNLLLKFSLPAIVGMLVNALYNIVDRIFIGQGVGFLAISGITISFPVMLVVMACSMLIGMGATSLISIRLGENKHEEADKIASNAAFLLVAVTLVLSGLGLFFFKPLLLLLGANNDIMPYAQEYLGIILSGSVFMSISFGMNNFIRAEGNPKIAMYTMLLGAITNVILDYIFIFPLQLGLKGAAYATITSQFCSMIWVLRYFYSQKSLLKLKLKNLYPQWHLVKKILTMGFPPFAMQIVASLQQVIMINALGIYGNSWSIATMGIIGSVSTVMIMPIIGISQGSQPIIGYNFGAKNFSRVKKTLFLAAVAATIVSVLSAAAIWLFSPQIINLFSAVDAQMITLATRALHIFFMCMPIVGFQIIGGNYFQAVGKPRQAALLTLSRQLLLYIPALLILPVWWGLDGVWLSSPVSDMGAFIITVLFIRHEFKYFGKVPKQDKTLDMAGNSK